MHIERAGHLDFPVFAIVPRFFLAACLLAVTPICRGEIDANANLLVWKMFYGVTDEQLADPAWMARDDDSDGRSNGAELTAGTNPFSASSNLAASAISASGGSATLTFSTVAGKIYILQSTTTLSDPASWASLTPIVQVSGDGTSKSLVSPPYDEPTFYRVLVQDTDTDGDGVSDWAERVSGFDPNNAHSHGATQDDHAALLDDLASENIVTVTATKATATQPPDAMTAASDTGSVTITRGGTLHFSTIKVPLNWSGTAQAGVDYALLPTSVTFPPKVGSITLTTTPLANAARRTSATLTLSALPGGGYSLGSARSASVVISPAGNAIGTGLTGNYFNSSSTAMKNGYNAALFNVTPTVSRTDETVNFQWNGAAPVTGVNATYFLVRWSGQVQPQYSETYYFDTLVDDGVKLWVNGKLLIDGWPYQGTDRLGAITLKAGVLYDIQMDYFQAGSSSQAHLSWYSDSQTKQVIPKNRLYPLSVVAAPPAITSADKAVGFVNQPFKFTVTTSMSGSVAGTFALGANSGPLPPGLNLDPSTGIISGIPTTAGEYQIALTATNALGVGASALNIQILNPGSGVTREIWQTGVVGSSVQGIPVNTAPATIDNDLTTLEDNTAYPDGTGERLRGYFTAPTTGNYYFWIAANNNAEFWMSDDAEPVNLIRRAWVKFPGESTRVWNDANQPNQRSSWLALVAGQVYYYEVLHNCGAGSASNNLAVGWMVDSNGVATTPDSGVGGGVVPGHLLSKYDYPASTAAAGILYVTNLSPQGVAASSGTGSANLRINPEKTQAILHFNYNGLSSPRTAYHIHAAQDATGSGPIVFDLDDVDKFHPELITADGGYIWNIVDAGALTAAQIVSAIQQGYAYFNVHTVNYPNGEIRGNLALVNGSQRAPTAVADPGFSDDSGSDAGAARFLNQAAYGAAPSDLTSVKNGGYASWIDDQIALPVTHISPDVLAHKSLNPVNSLTNKPVINAWWRAAVTAPDQLRQRVAFALSQVTVVSATNDTLASHGEGLASYYDTLADNAFGNFRDLLRAVTLHPTMGYYLNMQGNAKGNLATGLHPNENYAREILQLFSLGLNRLWPDGSLVLDSSGNLVPTYDQDEIQGLARVFTGWTWSQALLASGQLPTSFSPSSNYVIPMVLVPKQHELGSKAVLNHVVLPAATGYDPTTAAPAGSQALIGSAECDAYCTQDLEKALDNIFYHPNVGPYICRQLIQRLVESDPSPQYLHRVVLKFNDDGSAAHVRGNLQAVIRAILLDGEARVSGTATGAATSGKQREPLLRVAGPARTFLATSSGGTYSENGAQAITIQTTTPHRLSGGDSVTLDFTGNTIGTPSTPPWNNPSTANYTVLSTPAPTANVLTVNATSLLSAAYTQAANSNTITVSAAGPPVGDKLYLKFYSGGAPDGVYTVASLPDSTHFTVITAEATPPAAVRTGTVFAPKISGYYVISTAGNPAVTTFTVIGSANTNLRVNDPVYLVVATGSSSKITDQQLTVTSIIDENRFTVAVSGTLTSETNQTVTIYPLIPPPLLRSGSVAIAASKFDMGSTNGNLAQTPIDAPTVFNYFYPDYQFPGTLAAANATTPEFQLTTDTNIVNLTNAVNSMILTSTNTAGLSNFMSGAINFDLTTYMTAPYSAANVAGVTDLVNKLGDILAGGQLTTGTKSAIIGYVTNTTNFPTTSSTYTRDRVRAIVQMILASPEYAIQR